jgi:acyl-CoA thioesterase-1
LICHRLVRAAQALVSAVALLLAGFATAAEPLRVVTLGDSITRGVRPGVKAEETFAALLETALRDAGVDATVENRGVGGETTAGAVDRLVEIVELRPRAVAVMYGTNDSYVYTNEQEPRVTLEQYADNLRTIVARLRDAGAVAILMTPPAWGAKGEPNGIGEHPNVRLAQYAEVVRQVAEETGAPLVDHFAHWTKALDDGVDLGEWTTDQYHPNPRGHREIAELLAPIVIEVCKR